MKKYSFVLGSGLFLILLGVGCSATTIEEPPNITGYELSSSLIAIYEDGSKIPTGLVATSEGWPSFNIPPEIRLSPNKKYVAYAVWNLEPLGVQIHVSNLDGTDDRVVASQTVPEGQGELDTNSLFWIDDLNIQYTEAGVIWDETTPPSGGTWRVNIESGEKTLISL